MHLAHYICPALSCSAASCCVHACFTYSSICYAAWPRSSVTFLPRENCHVQWKIKRELALLKHIISAFTKRLSAKWTSLFQVFHQVLNAAQPEQCQYYVSSWAKRKESWGLWYKQQKVADQEIDVLCWCPPLKVITETDSHGSLKILQAGLRIRCWYWLIMRAPHSGCNDTVWLSNGDTWTLTPTLAQQRRGCHFLLNGCKWRSWPAGKHVERSSEGIKYMFSSFKNICLTAVPWKSFRKLSN